MLRLCCVSVWICSWNHQKTYLHMESDMFFFVFFGCCLFFLFFLPVSLLHQLCVRACLWLCVGGRGQGGVRACVCVCVCVRVPRCPTPSLSISVCVCSAYMYVCLLCSCMCARANVRLLCVYVCVRASGIGKPWVAEIHIQTCKKIKQKPLQSQLWYIYCCKRWKQWLALSMDLAQDTYISFTQSEYIILYI